MPILTTESIVDPELDTFELGSVCYEKISGHDKLVLVNSIRSEAPGSIRVARWFQGEFGGAEAGQ